ncbi:hypothetical protein DNTS_004958, partial [Danionella cerebrum]
PPSPELKVTPDGVVFTGERVELKCEIQSNLSGWRYEWSRGNSVIQSSGGFSVDGNTLTIAAADVTDGGQYWCRVFITGRSVSSRSNSVSLSVHSPPKLKVTPDRVVFTGERVELKCEIQSDLSGWRYEWSRGNGYIVIRSSYGFSVNGDTLTIANIAGSDEGVKPKPDLRSDSSAALTGNTVTLTCSMDPITGWDFYWYKTSQSSEIKKIEKKNSYLLEIDSESAGGQFWCRAGRGKPVFYSEFSNLLQINVSMSPKPVVMVRPAERVFGGEEVSLRCDVEWGGDTEWTYSWRTEGTNQNNQFKTTVSKTSNQELNFSRVDQSHSGKYFCTGHTGSQRSQSSEAVPLTVIPGEAQAALRVSPGPWLTEGDSVTLNCEVPDSSTGWRFSWFRDADLLSDSSRGAGGSYKLSPASLQHTGVYICRAQRGGAAYYTQNSSMELVWVSDAASSPGSLVVSPSRGQHFSFHSLSLSCDSSGWTVMRYTSSNPEDCSSQSGSLCGISSLQESDSGVYWCQSDSGEKHSPLNITVTQEDVILESPAGPVTEGETLTLLCSHRSRSSSILSAAFYKDGSLIQNQTTGEMSIAAVSESDEGFYSCRTEGGASPRSWISVRGAEGHFSLLKIITSLTTSSPFLLSTFVLLYKCHRARAPPFPELKVTPDRVVFTGERVELKCEIQSDLSGWRYVWRRGNSVIQLFGRFSVNGDTLTIERVTESDQGKYRCWGTTTEGASSGSSSVFLSVKAPPSPELKVTPDRVVFTGERVELKCEIQSDLMSWRYEWRRGNSVIQSSGGFSVDGNTLTIAAADVTDGGQYWCRVFITGRSVSSPSNSVSLSVYAPPFPELKVTPDRVVFTGERVELKCETQSDLSGWRYFWSRGNIYSVIRSSGGFSVDGNTLTIAAADVTNGAAVTDGGQYWCRVFIAGRSVSSPSNSVSLSVHAPPELKVTPDRVVFTGERVELKCEIQSELRSWRYEWSRGNGVIQSSGRFSVYGNTLTIEKVAGSDQGLYWCWGTTTEGASSGSSSVFLSVKAPPSPELKVTPDRVVFTGERVQLKCEIQSDLSGWRYEWSRRNSVIQSSGGFSVDGNTLTIAAADVTDGDQYWCSVFITGRSVSSPSNSVSLSVHAPPSPELKVTPDGVVFTGERVELKCEIQSYLSGWRYKWSRGNSVIQSSVRFSVDRNTLTIAAADVTDGDQYWCRVFIAGRLVSSPSNSVSLSVHAPPKLKVTPDGVVFTGERVELKCEIQPDLSGWRYEWSRGNIYSVIQSSHLFSVNGNTLTFANITGSDKGRYWCRRQQQDLSFSPLFLADGDMSGGEKTWSSALHLEVNGVKPKPDLRSDSSAALTGNTVTLTCSMDPITGWDFYWYKTSQSSEIKKIEKNNSYLLEIDSESAGGQFWCRAGRGKPVFYSEFSNLLQINVSVSPKAVVTVRPAERVFGGEAVSLRCDVKGGGDTEWMYSWRTEGTNHNKQFKTTVSKTSNQELNISRVDQSHSGKYFCTGHTGSQRSQSSEAVPLTVIPGEARAALRVSPGPWLTEGDSVTLNCEVPDSSTGWRFSWFRDADLLSDSSRGAGGSYKLSPASLQHTGVYICRAQRGGAAYYTQNSSMELVWVSDAASSPVSLVVNPSRGQHFSFHSLSLSCDSSGWTVRRYTSSNPEDCSSQSGSSCGISSLQESDSGVYWCQSDSGEKGSPLNITVTQEDVILDSPAGPVTEGKTLTLLCSHRSRSSSILSAAFYKDGSLIQNQTTGEMSIAAVSESDEGFYSCRTEGGASPRSWISVRASSSHLLVIAVAVGSSVFLLLIVLVLLLLRHKNKGLQRGIQQIPGPNSSGDPHQQNIPLQSEDEARANPWDNVMYSEIRKKIDMDTAGASDVVYAQITAKNTKTNKKQVYKGESTR